MIDARRASVAVRIGAVTVGGGAPVVVQSMTNTDTADVESTVRQVRELADAGSEIVRVTVNTDEAAAAVPLIKQRLLAQDCAVPIVGDFHFNGHKLLAAHPAAAAALDKYRINPGNVGRGSKRDPQFAAMIETACRHRKPVRIGVNWGSLDQDLLTRMMDENSKLPEPLDALEVLREATVVSALASAARAEELGLAARRDCHQQQGERRPGPDRDLPRAGRALRLPAAPRPDRGRHGREGHRLLDRGDRGPAPGGHRRHDPRVADAGTGRRSPPGSPRRPGDPAEPGPSRLPARASSPARVADARPAVISRSSRNASRITCASACRPGATITSAPRT